MHAFVYKLWYNKETIYCSSVAPSKICRYVAHSAGVHSSLALCISICHRNKHQYCISINQNNDVALLPGRASRSLRYAASQQKANKMYCLGHLPRLSVMFVVCGSYRFINHNKLRSSFSVDSRVKISTKTNHIQLGDSIDYEITLLC